MGRGGAGNKNDIRAAYATRAMEVSAVGQCVADAETVERFTVENATGLRANISRIGQLAAHAHVIVDIGKADDGFIGAFPFISVTND